MGLMELLDFLQARLNEDEQVARAAFAADHIGHPWEARGLGLGVWRAEYECIDADDMSIYAEGGHNQEQAAHIARHDPARVLAEVAAKRRIIELHRSRDDWTIGPDDREYLTGLACVIDDDPYPCTTLEMLALPYADHPDYDEAWKP